MCYYTAAAAAVAADDECDICTYLDLKDNGTLVEWVRELHGLASRCGGLMYPAGHDNSIPRDVVTSDTAQSAATLCSNIVEWCTQFINRN